MLLRKTLCLLCLAPGLLVMAAPPEPALPQLKPAKVLVHPAQVDFIAFVDSVSVLTSSYEAEWKPDPKNAKKVVQVRAGDHRLWDLGKEEPVWRLPRALQDRPIVLDGKLVLVDGEAPEGPNLPLKGLSIRILEAATGKESHQIEVVSRAWSLGAPDGLGVTLGQGVTFDGMKLDLTADKINPGKVKPQPVRTQGIPNKPVIYAPDGTVMVLNSYREMKIPGVPVNRVDPFYPVAVRTQLADGKGRVIAPLPLVAGVEWAGGAFSADSKKLAVAVDNSTIGIAGALDPKVVGAQIKDREERERRGYQQLVKILLCDARTGKELARFGKVGVSVLAFSADGRYLAASGRVKGRYTPNPDPKKNGGNNLGPEKEDPARAAVIQLWDLTTRKQVAELVGHEKAVTLLAFSPSGSYLASAGEDMTVQIWDLSRVGEAQAK